MTATTTAFLVLIASTLAALVLTGVVRAHLIRRAILDHPNDRSSHSAPTPRGGGLAIVAIIIITWLVLVFGFSLLPPKSLLILAAVVGLAVMSLLDDLRDLPARVRLLGHFAAVGLGLAAFDGAILWDGLPFWLDRAICFLGWVWFINLFNFMDGIDGISAAESIAIGLGLTALWTTIGLPDMGSGALLLALTITGSMLGFFWWNRPPAKVFLGDVGSVSLGYLLAWLLLVLAHQGFGVSALLLALYYLVDATWTLARRALRGEKIWQAHREHAYQRAVQRGFSHGRVSKAIFAVNLMLAVLAVFAAMGNPLLALTIGVTLTLGLMGYLYRAPGAVSS